MFIAIIMYFTKYIAVLCSNRQTLLFWMLDYSWDIFLPKSAQYKVSQSVPVFIRTMALLYVSQELFILFPLFYQVDSFSFFYFYATPPSLSAWFLGCFNDEQEYFNPFIEVFRYYTFPYHSHTRGLYSFISCLPQLRIIFDYWQSQLTPVRPDLDMMLCQ